MLRTACESNICKVNNLKVYYSNFCWMQFALNYIEWAANY